MSDSSQGATAVYPTVARGSPCPFREQLRCQQALAMMSLPSNLESSVSHLAHLMDEIWYLAGDRSVDVTLDLL